MSTKTEFVDMPMIPALPAPEPKPDVPTYEFIKELTTAMKSGSSRSLILSGSVQDLFFSKTKSKESYVPLVSLLIDKFSFDNKVNVGGEEVKLAILQLDLNDGIRFLNGCETSVVDMFVAWQIGLKKVEHLPAASKTTMAKVPGPTNPSTKGGSLEASRKSIVDTLYANLREARNNYGTALQILRRFVEASQFTNGPKLLIIIEGADLIVPAGGDLATLPTSMVRKLGILESWFSDPDFMDGKSTVVMLADSMSAIHPRVTRLMQITNIEVPAPSLNDRWHFIDHYYQSKGKTTQNNPKEFAEETAGLSIHSIRQLIVSQIALDETKPIPSKAISKQVSEFLKSQLGESIKYYKPNHKLDAVRGNRKLKVYGKDELIPRLQSKNSSALPAMVITGPIGVGKTFYIDAIAAEMDCPVLELGNIRSQWYGGTDIILDKLERLLWVIPKVLIMVPEADTAFGGVDKGIHDTERRLTGKIQSLMSNPGLKGKVCWVLDTARVDQLSPDIRRPGRADLIIPMFDPDDEDRKDFVDMLFDKIPQLKTAEAMTSLTSITKGFSAGLFGAIRGRIQSAIDQGKMESLDQLIWIVNDTMVPDITTDRRVQELNALLNSTSRSLLPDIYQNGDMSQYREKWANEIKALKGKSV
jgi:hypothetical protein